MTPQQSPSSGVNFAPTKPLIQLRDKSTPQPEHPLQKAIQERFDHYHRKDSEIWREIYSVMQLTSLFISGDQILRRNPVTGGWGILPIKQSTTSARSINYMQFYANMLMSKSLSSNPDILISAGRNKDQCISAARAANAVNNLYERTWFTPDFNRRETLFAITGGTYINRIRFDNSKESNAILADVFEQKPVQTKGFGFCGDCQYVGGEDEFKPQGFDAFRVQGLQPPDGGIDGVPTGASESPGGMCPECHSRSVTVESGANQTLPSVTGQQRYAQGDLVCEQMPLFGCRFDLNKRIEDSSWAINRQRVSLGSVHQALGNVNLPQSSSSESDLGLEMIESLAKAGQALYGSSGYGNVHRDDYKENVNFDEMWLSPEDYADVVIQADEETVSGQILRKGKLTETFPDGLVAVGLNGMTTLLGLHAEKHKDHIVSGAWNKKSLSGVGRGIADTVEVQKQSNILNSQRTDYLASMATPAIGYNKELIDSDKVKYLGSPKANIPFDMTKLPETAKLSEAIFQFQPSTGLLGQLGEYIETFLNNGLAYTTGVTEFTSGLPGMAGRNDTATGAQLEQSTADMVNMPIFSEKADVRKRMAEITIKQYMKHFPNERTIQLTGNNGEQQAIQLRGADLDTDLIYEVVKNSEIPKGPYQVRNNLTNFFAVTQGVEPYLMLVESKPQMASKLEQAFDVDLETDEFDDVAELCRKRLNQMKAAVDAGISDPLALVGAMIDPTGQIVPAPQGGAIQPPVSGAEPNLKRKAEWMADWLDSDEGQNSPPPLRAAVEMLAMGQIVYQTAQDSALAMAQGQVELAQQAPQMQAQQAMQPAEQPDQTAQIQGQQQEAESQAQTQQQAGDMLMRGSEMQHEAEQADAARQHESSEAAKERAHKEKIAKLTAKAKQTAARKKKAA